MTADLRYALRVLRRSPGFAATAVAVLAFGIGANVAVFSVVNAVLLRPLPYPQSDRLVQLMIRSQVGNLPATSIPKFIVWREETTAFAAMAAYQTVPSGTSVGGRYESESIRVMRVSAGYFSVFGMPIAAGRTFDDREDRPGGAPVAIISYGLWQRTFGGDPAILDGAIPIGNTPHAIIGVVGADFRPDPPADIWIPLQADPATLDHAAVVQVVARLKPGVTIDTARQQMYRASVPFRQRFPAALGPLEGFTAEPLLDVMVGGVRDALWMITAAVVVVLVIACGNLANLMLARAARRRMDIAMRAALGSSRWRTIRLLLAESVILSTAGGIASVFIAYAGIRLLVAQAPLAFPRIAERGAAIALDWHVLLFAAAAALMTNVIFGLLPAFGASRPDLAAVCQQSGAQSGSGLRHVALHRTLVIGELTLALVLLTAAGMMIQTFIAVRAVDRGFDPTNVLTAEMSLPGARFARTSAVVDLVRDVEQRLRPSGHLVALTSALPLEPALAVPFTLTRRTLSGSPYHGSATWRMVSPRYFDVFRIVRVRGRTFTDEDTRLLQPVAIINEAFAKRFWQNRDPIGETVTVGLAAATAFEELPRTIVGVVSDVRDAGPNRDPEPMIYVPTAQLADAVTARNNRAAPLKWVLRTRDDAGRSAGAFLRELRDASGGIPVWRVRTMASILADANARANFNTLVMALFAVAALALAAIGLYGLMAYSVEQRAIEIGIRLALGAEPRRVGRMVLWEGLQLTAAGLAVGLTAAVAPARVLRSLVYGIAAPAPIVLSGVAALLAGVALVATYLPARRATRINPIEILRG
jgi:predicted permease